MLSTFAKATYATVVTALGSLATVLVGNTSLTSVTAGQWVTAVVAGLVAGGGVYGITNTVSSTTVKGKL